MSGDELHSWGKRGKMGERAQIVGQEEGSLEVFL